MVGQYYLLAMKNGEFENLDNEVFLSYLKETDQKVNLSIKGRLDQLNDCLRNKDPRFKKLGVEFTFVPAIDWSLEDF